MIVAAYARKDLLVFALLLGAPTAALCWAATGLWPVFVAAFAIVWVLFALFFRDPDRSAPATPRVLVAPADGKIVEISESDESHFLRRPAYKLAIFMSVFDVHVNRSPCEGRIVSVRHEPGKFLGAMRAEASTENEANLIAIHNTEVDRPVLVKQIAGLVARRVVCVGKPDEILQRGQRIGMVKLGSRAEVYVGREAGFRWQVKLGERVRAGVSILGEWAE